VKSDLPKKYHIYYNYGKKMCATLKQAPLAKISNEVGKFSITKSSIELNFLNFEAIFFSGYRVYYQIGGTNLSLTDNKGEEIEVDIKEKLNKLNKDAQKIVRISLNYMEECIRIYGRSTVELWKEK